MYITFNSTHQHRLFFNKRMKSWANEMVCATERVRSWAAAMANLYREAPSRECERDGDGDVDREDQAGLVCSEEWSTSQCKFRL